MERLLLLSWFVQVRWAFLVGELIFVIVAANLFPGHFPKATLAALLCMSAASNFLLKYTARFADLLYFPVVRSTLAFDVVMLALILSLTGGHANPFSTLFLIHITLAAVLLDGRWMWVTLCLSTISYSALFFSPDNLPEVGLHAAHGGASLHLTGMLCSFFLTAAILGIFLSKLTTQLAAARADAARLSEAAAIGHLATNAAHELASPLNTVVLALESLCEPQMLVSLSPEARNEVQLANTELARAQKILRELPGRAGLTPGEQPQSFSLDELTDKLIAIGVSRCSISGEVTLPKTGLFYALKNLVQNSLTANATTVEVCSEIVNGKCMISVKDNGSGLPSAISENELYKPFISKSQTSNTGLGLGLFIVQNFAKDLGGSFKIKRLTDKNGSIDAKGTLAVITLPQHAV